MNTRTLKRNRRGISLLEVIVALGLLAIGMLAMVDLFPVAYEVADSGRDELLATHLGQAYIDGENSKDFYAMAGGQYTDSHLLALDGAKVPHTYKTFVTVTPMGTASLSSADKARVSVQVQWSARTMSGDSNLRYLQLETVRTREF
ncbi:MAG: prepilin-type N-terminal cleavage/methylation domain-containing protein [Armatimonadetes bacterium]|nr:prepilin-type N-terminal cleavage/methylation domain-containing protein [Armatimonadota bacterium]